MVKILSGEGGNAIAAGVLVGEKWVLTCRHVIDPLCDQIYLTFHLDTSGKSLKSHVIFLANENEPDIAILELDDVIPSWANVGNLVIKNNFWDHELKVCGYSSGEEGEWVSVVGRALTGPNSVQIDVTESTGYKIEEGFSGAPVFDVEFNYITGIVKSMEMAEDIFSGCFIPIGSIVNICKIKSVDTRIFGSLYEYDLDQPNTPLIKIAEQIATSLQRLLDKEIINNHIEDIACTYNMNIAPGLRDGDLCFHFAKALLNLSLDDASKILDELDDYNRTSEDFTSIFPLFATNWIDPKSITCIYKRALHKDNKKAVALNGNKHSSAKMCIFRASGRPPGKWPTYRGAGQYGINAADDVVKEIEGLLKTDMLRSGYLNEDMNPNEQRTKLKMSIQNHKKNGKPMFFILNYSKNIADSLTSAQEVFPCITLFLLTGDTYPQPNEFGKLDCACLLNLGLEAEEQIYTEIECACDLLGYSKFSRVIKEYFE